MASERAIWAGETIGRRSSLPGYWPEEGMLPVSAGDRLWPTSSTTGGCAGSVSASAGQMIEVQGLTKRYGATLAVDGLSFTVRPGLVTGFLGPNGAGKTTPCG
jgi:ABC-type multidrug transport system fused ATPase/permease subunit